MYLKRRKFNKSDRIRKSKEYGALVRKGRRLSNRCFVFNHRANNLNRNRLGITASKKVGKAVIRNRIKRVIREHFRNNRDKLGTGIDLNVIVRSESRSLSNEILVKQLENGFDSIRRKYVGIRSDEKTGTVSH